MIVEINNTERLRALKKNVRNKKKKIHSLKKLFRIKNYNIAQLREIRKTFESFFKKHHHRFQIMTAAVNELIEIKNISNFYNIFQNIVKKYNQVATEKKKILKKLS